MIDETGWCYIAVFVLFVAALCTLPLLRHRQWKAFASHRGGTVGSVLKQPFLEFSYHGQPVIVKSGGRDELAGVVATLVWPDRNLRLECRENGWLSGISQRNERGLEQVETGDAEFDEAYLVRGHTADEVNAFFDEATRRSFLRLVDAWSLRPTLSIEDGELRVRKPHSIWTSKGLEQMIEPLLEFYDTALANCFPADGQHGNSLR